MPHIKEFFTIRSVVAEDTESISYMTLKEHQNVTKALASIEDLAEELQAPQAGAFPWLRGTKQFGKVSRITETQIFVQIPGVAEEQPVDFSKVPGGRRGQLQELTRTGKMAFLESDGRQWPITRL